MLPTRMPHIKSNKTPQNNYRIPADLQSPTDTVIQTYLRNDHNHPPTFEEITPHNSKEKRTYSHHIIPDSHQIITLLHCWPVKPRKIHSYTVTFLEVEGHGMG
ncbi:hypothetical protein JTE90_004304 [Oedothorax gibbosus]|uniref:Uncharacterized protein n=1 Tax=Oedothorax gibbosus TaxID=931172 RepID=A0AAV6VKN9_9ARAC|nr:hypothetical protein JTE90_004304 [Oedothorax gibbosus]